MSKKPDTDEHQLTDSTSVPVTSSDASSSRHELQVSEQTMKQLREQLEVAIHERDDDRTMISNLQAAIREQRDAHMQQIAEERKSKREDERQIAALQVELAKLRDQQVIIY